MIRPNLKEMRSDLIAIDRQRLNRNVEFKKKDFSSRNLASIDIASVDQAQASSVSNQFSN